MKYENIYLHIKETQDEVCTVRDKLTDVTYMHPTVRSQPSSPPKTNP